MLLAQPAKAWWNGGHMTVAYIAYKNLNAATRQRVDQLLKTNPKYQSWTKGVSSSEKGLVAFINAATWPDCIKSPKCSPGYVSDGGDNPPGKPTDTQNIGYQDKLMHKYWHFYDTPYSAGSPGKPSKTPNALTEIEALTKAIGSSEPDNVKSYDVVWLEHLVGDVHQPLHATSRFTKNFPNGDAGGNDVAFCVTPCKDELHAFWDALLGDTPSFKQVSSVGDRLLANSVPPNANAADPTGWIQESFELAKSNVYIAPISDENDPSTKISPRPDQSYQANARNVAEKQVLLAGYRLAFLLNNNLK
jgi:hypothetical protein